jgi:hypothetical protein
VTLLSCGAFAADGKGEADGVEEHAAIIPASTDSMKSLKYGFLNNKYSALIVIVIFTLYLMKHIVTKWRRFVNM